MKTILDPSYAFGDNPGWKFVKKGYTFPLPDNPWAEDYPAVINNLELCNYWALNNVDFIAIKVGDVDGSYIEE